VFGETEGLMKPLKLSYDRRKGFRTSPYYQYDPLSAKVPYSMLLEALDDIDRLVDMLSRERRIDLKEEL
jgi:hypothetical protein